MALFTRRAAVLMLVPNTGHKPSSVRSAVSHKKNMEPNTVYVYETERFRAMHTVSTYDSCFVVKHRVDWYDPVDEKPRSSFDSTAYITDVGGER